MIVVQGCVLPVASSLAEAYCASVGVLYPSKQASEVLSGVVLRATSCRSVKEAVDRLGLDEIGKRTAEILSGKLNIELDEYF